MSDFHNATAKIQLLVETRKRSNVETVIFSRAYLRNEKRNFIPQRAEKNSLTIHLAFTFFSSYNKKTPEPIGSRRRSECVTRLVVLYATN